MVKCTPEELHAFYQQSQEKYPTFIPSRLPEKIMSPLTATATNQLAISMGLSKASKNVDLPYQTLFPSKNNVQQQQPANKKATVVTEITETNLLPFAEKGAKEPYYLTEANSAWLKHLYISVADYQVIHEREKAVHRWEHWNKNRTSQADSDEWDEMIYHRLNEKDSDKMHCIDQLYSSIMPNFQSIVVVILKLLLSTVSIGKDKEAEILEDINITRNRETISKAVSGILLLLLKWFKVSHVLKFEYLSQVLVDSGCMLLILKLLGLQEVALLASKKTDDQTQCFFEYMLEKEGSFEEESTKEEFYTNKRNLFWSINLLRVLQMLTKRKTHRISLLVQYKSSAILKRLLKVGHPVMDLYVLKNLKNQIPLMGRKWRSTNMKTISSIYAHCLTCLSDDWLSSPEGSMDSEEGATKEINLRMLTRLYNGHRYMPSILPSMDDMVGPESTLFYITENDHSENSSGKLPDYGLNSTLLLDGIELDVDFKRNYREWLEKDVYSTEEEDEEDDEEELCTDTTQNWTIGTPIPDTMPVPLSADDLTKEINKLYLEELQHEFEEKAKRQKETEMVQEVEDGWDKPIDFNHNAWGNTAVNPNENDEEADEVEPEVDPLGNIHWDSLTEEDLKRRLTLVEEKTVQRWLNVDMNDPRYLKVLNTFEGEGDLIPVDDEGWPI
ncbi:Factor arrest protein 11 [Rhizopus stolonifer]|uniref:Factor arrest protein 11 n=1 Tax=Rhizopus stolonifer TaxID=4846 RepID=A0A367KPR4_RHIST|nr:Factor arrest protein 11 [Rhizopus stolonifer]